MKGGIKVPGTRYVLIKAEINPSACAPPKMHYNPRLLKTQRENSEKTARQQRDHKGTTEEQQMNQIIITIGFFGVMMLMMAVGVLFGRRPLRGSCGGAGSECACLEAGTPDACKTETAPTGAARADTQDDSDEQ